MRKQWWPRLIIEIGDERHEFKTFMASEMQEISTLTDNRITDRGELAGYLGNEDAQAWRAIAKVAWKRQGKDLNFDEIDVDLSACDVWLVDEQGREVELRRVPLPCRPHRRRGIVEGCDLCGHLVGPETDKDDNYIWYFADDPDGDPVPTPRARRDSSPQPSN